VHVFDNASSCVLLLFDNDMNYLFEKSCASFVAASKVIYEINRWIDFDSVWY
jgi:hypothetical protein